MDRMRHIAFTLNNYTAQEVEALESMNQDGHFQYLVYGFEMGPSETPHLQG
jgi:hypothetical protein